MSSLSDLVVLVKGGGEAASGVAHRLHRAGFKVCVTELANPLAVCRGSCFSEAIYEKTKTIEDVTAELVPLDAEAINRAWSEGKISLVIDPEMTVKKLVKIDVLVDATMTKQKANISMNDAPLVIGLGIGFTAGKDVHILVETHQGNDLGRVLFEGEAEKDTKEPLAIGGLTFGRIIWAEKEGVFTTECDIGEYVEAGQVIAWLDDEPLKAPVAGILRGLIRGGFKVPKNAKLIEVDPVNDRSVIDSIRDKHRAIGGGVLEAIMYKYNR
ncbi:MAG: selenium-dependent molybdenum cofactor biosynthesis protein YqeB [Dehalococcoidales bacterium]